MPGIFAQLTVSIFLAATLISPAGCQIEQRPMLAPTKHLLVTAIVSHHEPPHHAYMQCLNITSTSFHTYPTVGESIFLSSAANTTLVILPPSSEEGWHRPPAPMWFILVQGKAVVQTPATGQEVVIAPPDRHLEEQQNTPLDYAAVNPQIVLALDVLGKGHLTFYPTEQETVALQIPLGPGLGGLEWDVAREGPC